MRLIGKIAVTVAAAMLLTAPAASADVIVEADVFGIPTQTINLITGFFDDPVLEVGLDLA